MPSTSRPQHVVVIGAGVVGLAGAWHLARRGVRVTVLDREAIGSSASCGNAGLFSIGHQPMTKPGLAIQAIKWMADSGSPLYVPPRFDLGLIAWLWRFHRHCNAAHLARCMEVLCRMGWLTIEIFEEMIREGGIACEYSRTGWLEVCLSEERLAKADRDAEGIRAYGYRVQRLDAESLHRREPAFLSGVAGAMWHSDSAYCSPGAFTRGLASACAALGVAVRTDAPVRRIEIDNGTARGAELADGSRVEGDVVLLAAGIWSSELARSAGVRVPMQPAKGYHRDLTGIEPLPTTGGVLAETFVAFNPINGGLRLAGTLELSGINDRRMPRRLEMLSAGARRYLRGVDGAAIRSEWGGMRPCTADGMPAIGWAPRVRGLFVATGHAMMGLTLAPVTGRLIAQLMLGETPCVETGMMRVERG